MYDQGQTGVMMAAEKLSALGPARETRRQVLERQKRQLENHIAKIDAALAALDANPNLGQFIETLQDAGV